MHIGAINTTVDPTKARPWYADILETGAAILQSERIRAENKRRIDAGLPPLTESQMRALAPTANVNVQLPPEIRYGLLIGGGLLIYLLATRRR